MLGVIAQQMEQLTTKFVRCEYNHFQETFKIYCLIFKEQEMLLEEVVKAWHKACEWLCMWSGRT